MRLKTVIFCLFIYILGFIFHQAHAQVFKNGNPVKTSASVSMSPQNIPQAPDGLNFSQSKVVSNTYSATANATEDYEDTLGISLPIPGPLNFNIYQFKTVEVRNQIKADAEAKIIANELGPDLILYRQGATLGNVEIDTGDNSRGPTPFKSITHTSYELDQ